MTEQGTLFGECPHQRKTVVPEKRGPHFAKQVCSDCGKFLGWMPKPETIKRRAENAVILAALSKLPDLPAWERQFVRDLSSHARTSPREQAKLLELQERFLTRGGSQ